LGEDELDWFEGVVVGINKINNQDLDLYIRYEGYDSEYLFSNDEFNSFSTGPVKTIAELQ
jgi:hypothetical protein